MELKEREGEREGDKEGKEKKEQEMQTKRMKYTTFLPVPQIKGNYSCMTSLLNLKICTYI